MPTPPAGDQENSFAPQMTFLGLRPGGWAKYAEYVKYKEYAEYTEPTKPT